VLLGPLPQTLMTVEAVVAKRRLFGDFGEWGVNLGGK
jgi:hypothetical protein